jgi:hypothetical protein
MKYPHGKGTGIYWPGFEVKCLKCGGTNVELSNTLGYSEASGSFGSVDFVCMNKECHNMVLIVE